jgi:hypothetical protein
MEKLAEIAKLQMHQMAGDNNIAAQVDDDNKKLTKSKYFTAKKSEKGYGNFLAKVGIKHPTDVESEIFLRLDSLVHEIASNEISALPAYVYSIEDDSMFKYFKFTTPKGVNDIKKMKEQIGKRIKKANFLSQKKSLKKYIKAYRFNGSDFESSINYSKQTGIVASKYYIHKLLTPENIQNVWGKLSIKIEKI